MMRWLLLPLHKHGWQGYIDIPAFFLISCFCLDNRTSTAGFLLFLFSMLLCLRFVTVSLTFTYLTHELFDWAAHCH